MPVRVLLIFGVLAALCWTVADVLLVGFVQPNDVSFLFPQNLVEALGDDADMAALMLRASPDRLFWGVVPAMFSVVLYLAASFGVYLLMRPSAFSNAAWGLLFCSYALSPLGHAGFYYVGMAAQGLSASPPDAQGVWLVQFGRFMGLLSVHWLAAVGLSAAGWFAVLLQIVRGRTVLPKSAAFFSPVPIGVAVAAVCGLFPESAVAASLGGASLNVAQLVFFSAALFFTRQQRLDMKS